MRSPFKVGDRIVLDAMPNDPCPVAPGTHGTVNYVMEDAFGMNDVQVGVAWDDGRSLSLIMPPDRAHHE